MFSPFHLPSGLHGLIQNLLNSTLGGQYQALDSGLDDSDQADNPRRGSTLIDRSNIVHYLEKKKLLNAINCVAGLAIFFFGYDQGVMGAVNDAEDYYDKTMHLGHRDSRTGQAIITKTFLQGLIVSVYYFGTLIGSLFGGSIGDQHGRIKTIGVGTGIAVIGAVLQASAQGAIWMILARVVNGFGTGTLNAIVPVWSTETAEHTSRGKFIAMEFTLNILGVASAYWVGYACSGSLSSSWRVPIGLQLLPLMILLVAIWFFPESPRWLAKVGRLDESRYVLLRLRGDDGIDDRNGVNEYNGICNEIALERAEDTPAQNYWTMLMGIRSGKLHIARRVQLVIWLQILQAWVGIAGVTIYAPTIFRIAGVDYGWMPGLNNTIYMVATLICVFTIDRIGRRHTLVWGSIVMGLLMLLAGFSSQSALIHSSAATNHYGIAAVVCIVSFTATFGATWLTVPWLYPAEIFPLQIRAQGNAWGVVGWSIGNAMLTILCPIMFEKLGATTFFVFAICNAITIPIVWALYPETNQRTLEEINLIFASDSIWSWNAERNFTPGCASAGDGGHSSQGSPIDRMMNAEELNQADKDDD